MPRILPKSFYHGKTDKIARDLLGCVLVHIVDGQRLSGRILETEAYMGVKDPACHSFKGRRTARVRSMYLAGGHAYVYFIYGMYFCFNVVTRTTDTPEAVLIRALEPLEGIADMKRRRPRAKRDQDLTSGPGKLCQALGIDRSCDGLKLSGPELFIEKGQRIGEIHASPRIGIDYAGEAANWPLRFQLKRGSKIKTPRLR